MTFRRRDRGRPLLLLLSLLLLLGLLLLLASNSVAADARMLPEESKKNDRKGGQKAMHEKGCRLADKTNDAKPQQSTT